MACQRLTDYDTSHSETKSQVTDDIVMTARLTEALFHQLPGTWNLDRRLESINTSEPCGTCFGTATFTPREPSVFIDRDGKLELASAEMVYHEQGHFEMSQVPAQAQNARFSFSRKYIWRLQHHADRKKSVLSIWFTKPGTESIDYLFHKVNGSIASDANDEQRPSVIDLQMDGGHLCEEDFYSSAYTFSFLRQEGLSQSVDELAKLERWTMLHEVRGPKKDQVIESNFTKI